jgi:site-specific recombinase XerD
MEQFDADIVLTGLMSTHRKVELMDQTDPCIRLRLRHAPEGPAADYLGAFEKVLNREGYAPESILGQLRLVSNFSAWLRMKNIPLKKLTQECARFYLRYRYRSHHRRRDRHDQPVLRRFIRVLQEMKIIKPDTPAAPTAAERWLASYAAYLQNDLGLSKATIDSYVLKVRPFLNAHLRTKSMRLDDLTAADAIDYVRSEVVRLGNPSSTKTVPAALRSFLRYARYCNAIKLDLACAVPSAPCWAMTSIPRAIPPEHARRALACCNRRMSVGRRDYAILLLLARLGLRAGEIVRLRLDDIDWESGTLTIHGKGHRDSALPLLADVGAAIAAYLRDGRPRCGSRRVFLCAQAPVRSFKNGNTVSNVVKYALERAGIESPRNGAHQFRHALATEMLRRKSSLSEIGEVLRHKNPDTTKIYTKVDLHSLRELAPPWPDA